jgi:hypothetical protein
VGRDAGLPYAECDGQQQRFLALVELGDVVAADAAIAATRAALRTPRSRSTAKFLEAARALLAGRLADAEAAALRAREASLEARTPPHVAQSAYVRLLSCVRLVQGRLTDHEPARSAMAQGVTNLPATFYVVRAHAARERDDRDGAQAAFAAALAQGLLELPRGPTWAITLAWAADICAWLGDRATAATLLDLLAPFAGVMTWQYGPVGRAVAVLELALGDPDEAERRLRDAVALCERMDARAFLAIARVDLATLLLPSAEGRTLLAEARAAAEELGMPGLGERARAVSG